MKRLKINSKHVWVILLFAGLMPYIAISYYCNPVADDFTYADKSRSKGFYTAYVDEYNGWNGRYSSNAFVLLSPLKISTTFYKLVPVLLILLLQISVAVLLKQIISESFLRCFLYSGFIVLIFLNAMPDLAEGIYWYTGAVTYVLGCVFAMFYFAALAVMFNKIKRQKAWILYFVLTVLLMAATIGFNEVLMIYVLLLNFCIALVSLINKMSIRMHSGILFLFSVLFSGIMFFSPGNESREAYFTSNHDFIYSLWMSLLQTLRFLFDWIFNPVILTASVLFAGAHKKLFPGAELQLNSLYLSPFAAFMLIFACVFLSAFPAYWSTGILGQHRTVNCALLFFIFLWFIFLTSLFNKYKLNYEVLFSGNKNTIFALLFVSLIYVYGNSGLVLKDIFSGKAKSFDLEIESRHKAIAETKADTLVLDTLTSKPASIFVLDITDDPGHWINMGYGIYFQKQNLKILVSKKQI